MTRPLNNFEQLENFDKKLLFKNDIVDLFTGRKSAHLSSYTFEHSADLWNEFYNTPSDYYVIKDEINLIRDNTRTIRKICSGVQNVIDLGPGSEGAVTNKTLPILESFRFHLRQYIAIDISIEYLLGAKKIVGTAFQDTPCLLVQDNFFNPQNLPVDHRTMALLLGITVSNMPGITDKESGVRYLKKELSIFRALLPRGSYFLCSFDVCQNREKLMKAYNQPKHGKFIESIASKIKRDLDLGAGFDENGWVYSPRWDDKNHMFRHVITSTKDMQFSIDDHLFHIPSGYDILSYVSVKFPEQVYLKIIEETGFRLVSDLLRGPDGDISIAILQAV